MANLSSPGTDPDGDGRRHAADRSHARVGRLRVRRPRGAAVHRPDEQLGAAAGTAVVSASRSDLQNRYGSVIVQFPNGTNGRVGQAPIELLSDTSTDARAVPAETSRMDASREK